MTTPESPATPPPSQPTGWQIALAIGAAVVGFVVAIVLDFILSAQNFSLSGGSPPIGIGQIAVSWLVTVGLGFVLYKMHRWALYGMLAGYAALFLLLLMGGIFGPYTCFGTYGYPPYR